MNKKKYCYEFTDVRYNLTEKEDAEKKQKALEKLEKVIENSSINKEHTKSNINF